MGLKQLYLVEIFSLAKYGSSATFNMANTSFFIQSICFYIVSHGTAETFTNCTLNLALPRDQVNRCKRNKNAFQ